MVEILFEPQKLAYRIDEAVKASGLGRSFLYERMAAGELKSIKVGGRRLILQSELVDFLNRSARIPDLPPVPPSNSVRAAKTEPKLSVHADQLEFRWQR